MLEAPLIAPFVNPSQRTKLSEEMWNEYINIHIKKFEEENFRMQLMKSLNENHPF